MGALDRIDAFNAKVDELFPELSDGTAYEHQRSSECAVNIDNGVYMEAYVSEDMVNFVSLCATLEETLITCYEAFNEWVSNITPYVTAVVNMIEIEIEEKDTNV